MKILLIGECNAFHLIKWANAFSERGHSVKVVCLKNHTKNISALNKNIELEVLPVPSPFGYYLNATKLKKIAKKYNADIVNVHFASGYATLARHAKLKHSLLNIWGSDVYDFPHENKWNFKTLKHNLEYFDYLASTSECMAIETKKHIDKEIYITPFGVDKRVFYPVEKKKKDKIVLGTIKTLKPKYGIDYAIMGFKEVLDMLIKNNKNEIADKLEYHIYASGDKGPYQSLIDSLGLSEKIKLMGFVDNSKLNEVANAFDLGIYTSMCDSESFGVALVELMATKTPFIATSVDGFNEVTGNGTIIDTIPTKDSHAIAGAIYDYLLDPKKCDKTEELYYRYLDKYEWGNNVDNMLNIYEHIIKGRQ